MGRPRRRALVAALLTAMTLAGCAGARATPVAGAGTGSGGSSGSGATAARRAVTTRVVTFVDTRRTIQYPGQRRRLRPLVTVIRYPTVGTGPLPLIVFGHGFTVTPADYSHLLTAWAAAGYVVAAPVFPLQNAHAPGGPNESDLSNQPADMSFVISSLLGLSGRRAGFLAGRISPSEIGVSGHSDGGETALAIAYDRFYLDSRVKAAAILSGAELPNAQAVYFSRASPPLLATQGTADVINPPHFTYDFYAAARRPKYLLRLLGGAHLTPYTTQQPQLSIVARVTIAFYDRYLKDDRSASTRLARDGNLRGLAALTAAP